MVASGSKEASVRLWDAASGRQVRVLDGHTAEVRALAFSPDGALLASGSEDETVRLWRLPGGEPLLTLRPGSSGASLSFTPDGRYLVGGLGNGQIKIWYVGR
jgi:WD40 repeat protein